MYIYQGPCQKPPNDQKNDRQISPLPPPTAYPVYSILRDNSLPTQSLASDRQPVPFLERLSSSRVGRVCDPLQKELLAEHYRFTVA
jgi:hypothetical protein